MQIVTDLIQTIVEIVLITTNVIDQVCWTLSEPSTNCTTPEPTIPFMEKNWILSECATEYRCEPSEFTLRGKQEKHFYCHVTPNWAGIFKSYLTIDILRNDIPIYIPISHNCVIPKLIVQPETFEFEAVVGSTTTLEVTVSNIEKVHGFCSVWHDNLIENCTVFCTPEKDIIPPFTRRCFLIKLKPITTDRIKTDIIFKTLGICNGSKISISGEVFSPKLIVEPKIIEKTVYVLNQSQQILELKNQNDVTIAYQVQLLTSAPDCVWLDEIDGILAGNCSKDIQIHTLFRTTGLHKATILVLSEHGGKSVIIL